MSIRKSRDGGISRLALAVAALFTLSACAAGPVYKPKGPDDNVGYTDKQLTANRYRVTFTGNSAVKREAVEDYLMRRAAEVTLAAGYTHFAFDARDTKSSTYYRSTFDDWGPRFGGYYGRYYGRGFGPGFGRGFYGAGRGLWGPGHFDDDLTPVTRFSAYSEIVMLTPQQAQGNPAAISARDVLARLAAPPGGPSAAPPPPPGAPPPPPPNAPPPPPNASAPQALPGAAGGSRNS